MNYITKESFIGIKNDVAEAFLLTLETLSSYVIEKHRLQNNTV